MKKNKIFLSNQEENYVLLFSSVYWPYKFWQYQNQQQSKINLDNNDTCERATSPVRILTPAKRLITPTVSNRLNHSSDSTRSSTTSIRSNDNNRQSSRRSYRILTSRSTSTINDFKSPSANFNGKTPLI